MNRDYIEYNLIQDGFASAKIVGIRGVNHDNSPSRIPDFEKEVKTGLYMDNLWKKGPRYRRQFYLLDLLLKRSVDSGGVTVTDNKKIKEHFEYFYKINISNKQIYNLLKKLHKDNQIWFKCEKTKRYESVGSDNKKTFKFSRRRITYVWSTFYLNRCKINKDIAPKNVSDLRIQAKEVKVKYKVHDSTPSFKFDRKTRTKKEYTIIPFFKNQQDAIKKQVLPEHFLHGINDKHGNSLVWGWLDVKSYRDQGYKEFRSLIGRSPKDMARLRGFFTSKALNIKPKRKRK